MALYQPGDSVRIPFNIYDANGTPADANTVTITLTTPLDVATTYTYNSDALLTKLATGRYQLLVYVPDSTASVGTWQYKGKAVDGSGNSLTVSKVSFEVG